MTGLELRTILGHFNEEERWRMSDTQQEQTETIMKNVLDGLLSRTWRNKPIDWAVKSIPDQATVPEKVADLTLTLGMLGKHVKGLYQQILSGSKVGMPVSAQHEIGKATHDLLVLLRSDEKVDEPAKNTREYIEAIPDNLLIVGPAYQIVAHIIEVKKSHSLFVSAKFA